MNNEFDEFVWRKEHVPRNISKMSFTQECPFIVSQIVCLK